MVVFIISLCSRSIKSIYQKRWKTIRKTMVFSRCVTWFRRRPQEQVPVAPCRVIAKTFKNQWFFNVFLCEIVEKPMVFQWFLKWTFVRKPLKNNGFWTYFGFAFAKKWSRPRARQQPARSQTSKTFKNQWFFNSFSMVCLRHFRSPKPQKKMKLDLQVKRRFYHF